MHFEPGVPYHIYNRGNNKQLIFHDNSNYTYFLEKVRSEWLPYCEICAFCLMPNHFHFVCIPNDRACLAVLQDGHPSCLQNFSRTIGHGLSTYARAVHKERNTCGALFQKKTKAKILLPGEGFGRRAPDYFDTCIKYVEHNPVKAGLVTKAEDWQWSSVLDLPGLLKQRPGSGLYLP